MGYRVAPVGQLQRDYCFLGAAPVEQKAAMFLDIDIGG
jgi:hypothetical protein